MERCLASGPANRAGLIHGLPSRLVALGFPSMRFPAEIAKSIEIESPPIPREEHPLKLVFDLKDVEVERERMEALGVQILRRPWQKPGEACDAVDPEGNIFQICSPCR